MKRTPLELKLLKLLSEINVTFAREKCEHQHKNDAQEAARLRAEMKKILADYQGDL